MEALRVNRDVRDSQGDFGSFKREWEKANRKEKARIERADIRLVTSSLYEYKERIEADLFIGPVNQVLLKNLDQIEKQIKEAKEFILSEEYLEEGDVDLINIETFERAINFLRSYANHVLQAYNEILSTPYIDALKDGSISIDWNNKGAKFLIIFKNNNPGIAYFYGERANGIPYKSAIETNNKIDESLAIWMKEYLT